MARSVYLDRLVTNYTPTVLMSWNGTVATWTIPYSVALDGSEGTLVMIRADTFLPLGAIQTAPNQFSIATVVDLTALDVFIGVTYESLYRLSTIFPRKQDQAQTAETRGRLNVGFLGVTLEDSTDLTVRVSGDGRNPIDNVFKQASPTDAKVRVPVMGKNDRTTIELLTDTYGPFNLAEIVWEGDLIITGRETQR